MPAASLTLADLTPFAPDIDQVKALAMIEDALAMAARVAPCITDDAFAHDRAARAILRGAVLRWHESGSGVLSQQAAGPYQQSFDTRTARKAMFWPSEIRQLQDLCKGDVDSGAFAVDTVGSSVVLHNETCALFRGAAYCSCGAVLTGALPLYGA